MEFNKIATLRNLKKLEATIESWYDLYKGMSGNSDLKNKCYANLTFVRCLMDDIECGRITELPTEEVA